MDVFEALNATSWILAIVVGIGFIRLLWPKDRSQVFGTIGLLVLIVAMLILGALLSAVAAPNSSPA